MPFPITIGDLTAVDAPSLGQLALQDCRSGGGSVVPQQRPSRWIMDLVRQGALDGKLAIGLAAGLLQSNEAAALAEGARLAKDLGDAKLGEMIGLLLEVLDIGILLTRDPLRADRSVEDTLLIAWAELADSTDAETRAALLTRLRNAGMSELETGVLVRRGTPEEIRMWLPAIAREGVPRAAATAVAAGLARGGDVRNALEETLGQLPPADKTFFLHSSQARS